MTRESTPDPHGRIVARLRLDQRAGSLVQLACPAEDVAADPLVREVSESVAARLLDRVAGDLSSERGGRWAREDEVCARWVLEASHRVGAPLYVRRAARFELQQGRVLGRVDREGRLGAMLAVRTGAPAARADPLVAQLCRRLLAGEAPRELSQRLRRLGAGSEMQGSARFAVGT